MVLSLFGRRGETKNWNGGAGDGVLVHKQRLQLFLSKKDFEFCKKHTGHFILQKSYWNRHCIPSPRESGWRILKGRLISRLQIPASLGGRTLLRGSDLASQTSRVSANWERGWREAFKRNVCSAHTPGVCLPLSLLLGLLSNCFSLSELVNS